MESLYCPHSVPTTETILASSYVHPSFPLSTQQFILLFGCISKVSCECQFTSPLNPLVGISLTILWFFCFRGKICLQWNSQTLNALFCEFWQIQSRVTKPLLRYGTWKKKKIWNVNLFLSNWVMLHLSEDFGGNSHGSQKQESMSSSFPLTSGCLEILRYVCGLLPACVQDMLCISVSSYSPFSAISLSVIFKSCWGIYNSTSWFSNPFFGTRLKEFCIIIVEFSRYFNGLWWPNMWNWGCSSKSGMNWYPIHRVWTCV